MIPVYTATKPSNIIKQLVRARGLYKIKIRLIECSIVIHSMVIGRYRYDVPRGKTFKIDKKQIYKACVLEHYKSQPSGIIRTGDARFLEYFNQMKPDMLAFGTAVMLYEKKMANLPQLLKGLGMLEEVPRSGLGGVQSKEDKDAKDLFKDMTTRDYSNGQ